MYMTVADLQKKLNNVLKEHPELDTMAIITDCTIVRPEDRRKDIPNGSIVFDCWVKENGENLCKELQIYPDPPSRIMQ